MQDIYKWSKGAEDHHGENSEHHDKVMSRQESIAYEKKVFHELKWCHLASFLIILTVFELKRRGCYITG